jgi:hypothetical protein
VISRSSGARLPRGRVACSPCAGRSARRAVLGTPMAADQAPTPDPCPRSTTATATRVPADRPSSAGSLATTPNAVNPQTDNSAPQPMNNVINRIRPILATQGGAAHLAPCPRFVALSSGARRPGWRVQRRTPLDVSQIYCLDCYECCPVQVLGAAGSAGVVAGVVRGHRGRRLRPRSGASRRSRLTSA